MAARKKSLESTSGADRACHQRLVRQAVVGPSRFHWECPFCGTACDRFTVLRWCSGCYCEYSKGGRFDQRKKTERFAFAKAVQKSGGISLTNAKGEATPPEPR